jgi:hypothetical protein
MRDTYVDGEVEQVEGAGVRLVAFLVCTTGESGGLCLGLDVELA